MDSYSESPNFVAAQLAHQEDMRWLEQRRKKREKTVAANLGAVAFGGPTKIRPKPKKPVSRHCHWGR